MNNNEGDNVQGFGGNRFNTNSNGARGGDNNPVTQLQNHLFYALFYRITITYAHSFPQPMRRVLEFALLLKVIYEFLFSLNYGRI